MAYSRQVKHVYVASRLLDGATHIDGKILPITLWLQLPVFHRDVFIDTPRNALYPCSMHSLHLVKLTTKANDGTEA